jgi:CHAT domain
MPGTDYRDFEIHISSPLADGAYLIAVRTEPDLRANGTFVPPYSQAEVDQALAWMEQGLFDAEYVRQFGGKLFRALFVGDLKKVYDAARSSKTQLRFRLIADAPLLMRIPWELLYNPDAEEFLAVAGPLVRGVSLTEPANPLEITPPLRMLVIDALPKGVQRLASQAEASGIRAALADLIRSGQVEVETLSHATLARLQNALREAIALARPRPFHLLHFIGHGQHDPVSGQTALLFENDAGEIDEVDAATLTTLLKPYELKLVFLNACQSIQASALDLVLGFAPALLKSGMPAVIGMQVTVLDDVAQQFARDFYAALADNRPVDLALTDARQLARGTHQRRKADMGIPVCYLRTPNGQIFQLDPAAARPQPRPWTRAWLLQNATPRRIAAGIISLLGLIGLLVGLSLDLPEFVQNVTEQIYPPTSTAQPTSTPRPTNVPPPTSTPVVVMTGDINIAVAEFGVLDQQGRAGGSQIALALAQSVYTRLDEELRVPTAVGGPLSFIFDVRSPSSTGPIAGANARERAQSAARLASVIHADVIVYGNLDTGSTKFIPEFYVSDRSLLTAEELTGQYELGSPIDASADITRNAPARAELSNQLETRTRALAQFAIGLGYFVLDRYDDAQRYFQAAESTKDWDSHDGKEVLYLFLGSTDLVRQDWAGAQEQYTMALALNPEYARALIGLAEVQLNMSLQSECQPGTADVAGLKAAIQYYQRGQAAPIQPPLSDVPLKVALGLGRADLCLSQAGDADHWIAAASAFQQVIDAYTGGNQRIKELAARAYFGQAAIYEHQQSDHQAEQAYQAGIELTRFPMLRAAYALPLARLLLRQHKCDAVDEALARADENYAKARTSGQKPIPLYEEQRLLIGDDRFNSACQSPSPTGN